MFQKFDNRTFETNCSALEKNEKNRSIWEIWLSVDLWNFAGSLSLPSYFVNGDHHIGLGDAINVVCIKPQNSEGNKLLLNSMKYEDNTFA